MNFNDLKIFKIVYENESINKAATQLQYAQSNVSQRINHIEKELGVSLLIRTSKGIQANKHGEEFYCYCLKVIHDTEIMKTKMLKRDSSMLCSELLFSYLSAIKELDISWSIDIATTSKINNKIERKNYDTVIVFNKLSVPQYTLKEVHNIDLKLYGNKEGQNKLPLLVNKDQQCPLRKLSLKLLSSNQKVLELNSLEGIVNLVESGKGKALLPKFFEKKRELGSNNSKIYKVNYYIYQSNNTTYNGYYTGSFSK
ncbi:LysR family transcriptional regulator [Staphylococcus equorum]|uniref:LysR family transcriptional regulator n=1 Tax=Staphylococcus equorum TaxID=246432 RepID=UPI000E68C182|nr:LysR family transcriptional regulator [Staphylococcus equorum]RIL38279.1 LysR family transcriptional regulator [Staphylococcus equorum]